MQQCVDKATGGCEDTYWDCHKTVISDLTPGTRSSALTLSTAKETRSRSRTTRARITTRVTPTTTSGVQGRRTHDVRCARHLEDVRRARRPHLPSPRGVGESGPPEVHRLSGRATGPVRRRTSLRDAGLELGARGRRRDAAAPNVLAMPRCATERRAHARDQGAAIRSGEANAAGTIARRRFSRGTCLA